MSQGPFRNNPSLRIEIGKWSVKVERLEHRSLSYGTVAGVDDEWEIPLKRVKTLM